MNAIADAPIPPPPAPAVTAPARTPGYVGLRLRQSAEGVVVAGVQPGPLDGDGFKSPSIWRGDLIVSMNGQFLDAPGYVRLVHSLAAGDTLRVAYRRSASADPHSAVPRGDPAGEERIVEIVLDDAGRWSVPIGRGLAPGRAAPVAAAGEFEDFVLTTAGQLGLRAAPLGVDPLVTYVASVQQRLLAPDTLPAVMQALKRPLALDRIEADFGMHVLPLATAEPPQATLLALHALILRTLDVPDVQGLPDVGATLSEARQAHGRHAQALMRALRSDAGLLGPQLPQHLELLRSARDIVPLSIGMLPDVARHAAALERFARDAIASPQAIDREIAERVGAAVDGPVLAARLVDGMLWVVGSDAPNRYDMGAIAAVFDAGGADTYAFPSPASGPYQIILDAAGDDVYEAKSDFAGPATGFFSASLLWDGGGDDRYVSQHHLSVAAGLFGLGILIDDAGDDRYIADGRDAGWSQGAALYGAGVLLDRGGDDLYDAQILAQAVGGPGGLGLVVDVSGADTYIANGPHVPSAYGTPQVFLGMSQGMGTGIRDIAAGGIGALYDLGGDDFYSVGEFGQGTGYFQGLGIVHDAGGDDRYVGSRYAQGTGVHQAAGILIDAAGDDTYLVPGSAAQGAAWDQSVGMLVDRGGDDSYAGHHLAQGAAAQQAIGVLVDLDGGDRYACNGACLGQGSDNSYHYDASRVFSFSVFLDRGGRHDDYPQGRHNDGLMAIGAAHADDPARSDCCGMFLDD